MGLINFLNPHQPINRRQLKFLTMARIPILMYHHITTESGKDLVISVNHLEEQFKYLATCGYQSHHLRDLLSLKKLPKGKNVVITFDDVYVSHLELALPLLKKYKLKATFFAPLKFLGKTDGWNTSQLPIVTTEQLKEMDPEIIELGYHSFDHLVYSELTNTEVETDLKKCLEFVSDNKLNFSPILAYPYGKFPRKEPENKVFNKILSQNGIQYGLRVGNRLNRFPFKKPYEIQRIDIKGEWPLSKFKRKIRFGKFL